MTTTAVPSQIRARNSSITHYKAREVPGRLGTRFVALCGASMFHLAYSSGSTMCEHCVAKQAQA